MQGAVVVEKSESDSESVVAGDQEGEDVVESVSDAVGDGDGESAEADNLETFCVNIDFFWVLRLCISAHISLFAGTLITLLKSDCLLVFLVLILFLSFCMLSSLFGLWQFCFPHQVIHPISVVNVLTESVSQPDASV